MASERGAQRDIQAARMRGDLPPEVDAQDSSKLVNPHVPSFMSTAPWYVSKGEGPTLAHQRLQKEGIVDQSMSALESLYVRGQKDASGVAGKFRPGACRNCGAMTHAERDCVERPRKVGAWKAGVQLAADEVASGVASAGLKLGWDAKRDKYAGYDAAQQVARAAQMFSEAEALRTAHLKAEAERLDRERAQAREARRASRKRARREAGAAGAGAGAAGGGDDGATASEADGDTGDDADSFSGGSEGEEGGGAVRAPRTVEEEMKLGRSAEPGAGGQAQMTGWNMRSRENTAKYLLNLDPDSAFYDPKTRSMRENPFKGTGKDPKELLYAGDTAAMMKGDTLEMKKAELFAWEAYQATGDADVHLQANPTQTELLRKQASTRQAAVTSLLQQRILSAYGDGSAGAGVGGAGGAGAGASSSSSSSAIALPAELRLGDTEAFIEYGLDGRPLAVAAAEASAARAAAEAAARRFIAPAAGAAKSALHGAEDVHPGNHSSVWGSWFNRRNMRWGYACCFSQLKGAYCTGELGRQAFEKEHGGQGGAGAGAEQAAGAGAGAGGEGKKRPRE